MWKNNKYKDKKANYHLPNRNQGLFSGDKSAIPLPSLPFGIKKSKKTG
ncbi:MAG: hypothetical protein LBL07_08965 [Tannerella sp.]|jgi:hypothetical protein|nr:hypothetical protein [Tannerella sp.]